MKHQSFLIAFFATIVRYYDYALFGLSAAVLSKTFMPSASVDRQMIDFFAIFSLSALARPIGSLILGKIGDSYGRVWVLKISAGLASFSTGIIAILPSFESIGWWALAILTFSRMIFLMSLAGEVDTIRIYIAEKVAKDNKNTLNGVVSFCGQIGALLAAAAYYFANLHQDYHLWRVNFIIGGIGGVIVLLLRHHFKETEEFLEFKSQSLRTGVRLDTTLTVIKNHFPEFIAATLIYGCVGGVYNFSIIFFCIFLSKVANLINIEQAELINIWLIATYAALSLIAGSLADRVNVRNLVYISIVFSIIGLLLALSVGNEKMFIYYPLFIVAFLPFYSIPLQIKIQSLFNVSVRARMCSLSHSLGGMILSGTTPLIGMILWEYYNSVTLVLSFLLILFFILACSVLKIFKI